MPRSDAFSKLSSIATSRGRSVLFATICKRIILLVPPKVILTQDMIRNKKLLTVVFIYKNPVY